MGIPLLWEMCLGRFVVSLSRTCAGACSRSIMSIMFFQLLFSQTSQVAIFGHPCGETESLAEEDCCQNMSPSVMQYNHVFACADLLVQWSLSFTDLLGLALQWNLWIKDTLEPAILSSVERLSSSWRLKMNYCYGKGVQKCVLYWEVVPFSEGPLLEVPL